ncbi:hypothetical protein P171DRAFT_434161 [Karstenula rhodostoma CBS 690.94]|uniref:Uncharacterized protein n=1 Tax=Karstenula rhodostoma CBS 690.94 TaxID=1392251 RepID=A0A9P4PDQ2_9PLEO|nr:hypothetical protein P171DRAFT_434161 [Karstenula rhodostoma CBS 690.94]
MRVSIVGRAGSPYLKAYSLCRTSTSALRNYSTGERPRTSSPQSIFCLGERHWRYRLNGSIQSIPHHHKRYFASVVSDAVLPWIRQTNAASEVQRTWQVDDSWAAQLSTPDSEEAQKETMQQRVRRHIDALYPECARAGTIEEMNEGRYPLEDGTCSLHTCRDIIVLDDDFTGVLHSLVMVVNLPADADVTPGAWLGSQVMEEAKRHILLALSEGLKECNVKHVVCRVFVGGDAVWCRFRPEKVEPTITALDSKTAEFKNKLDEASRSLREAGGALPMGTFRGVMFEWVLRSLYIKHLGCTVWDEGNACAEPTRLLVVRRFETKPEYHFQPEVDVEATVYEVSRKFADPKVTKPLRMLRSRDPKRHHGEIVGAALIVATPLEDVWPKCGDYTESATMEAAKVCDEGEMTATLDGEATWIHDSRLVVAKDPTKTTNNVLAALHLMPLPDPDMSWSQISDANWLGTKQMWVAEYLLKEVLKQWYKEGKLAEDCLAQVIMGNDTTMYRFVDGERFEDYPEERMKLFKMQC